MTDDKKEEQLRSFMAGNASIESRTVVSAPGAAVEVTTLKLTTAAKAALNAGVSNFPGPTSGLPPIAWWDSLSTTTVTTTSGPRQCRPRSSNSG